MPTLSPERLRLFALDALEEAIAEAELRPVRRTWALRLALAYLASLHPRNWAHGEPYRDFWRALALPSAAVRIRALEQALLTIYAWADVKRDRDRTGALRIWSHGQIQEQARGTRSIE